MSISAIRGAPSDGVGARSLAARPQSLKLVYVGSIPTELAAVHVPMALGDPYCTLTDTCSCQSCRLASLEDQVRALKAEVSAWQKLAAWQTADRTLSWFKREGIHAYLGGKIAATGTAVFVAEKLGIRLAGEEADESRTVPVLPAPSP